MTQRRKFRRWIKWIVIGVWGGTTILVFVLYKIHPPALASVSLTVRQLSFITNATGILSRSNQQQLIISGISTLEIHSAQPLKATANSASLAQANSLKAIGESLATCHFDNVSSSGLKLSGPSIVTLTWPEMKSSFGILFHGTVAGNLTSQSGSQEVKSGLYCTGVTIDGKVSQNLDIEFLPSAGASIDFTTAIDARLDFRDIAPSSFGDSQILISEPLHISYREPGLSSEDEKSVLLTPPAGEKNRIVFDGIGNEIVVDNADLVVIVPENNFYLRQFRVNDGIALNLHGTVKDIKAGAGVNDLQSKMPSLLAHLDKKSWVLVLIPSIAVLAIGILEKTGILPSK